MDKDLQVQLDETCVYVNSKTEEKPEIAIVLGSGLSPLADEVEDSVIIPYEQIPHFVKSTVEGHAGELVIGRLKGKRVICMNGRFHYYEGYPLDVVTYPIKLFKALGIKYLILSNAVGGINDQFSAGDLMVIRDHLNLMGRNPLIGPNLDTLGPRFPDMSSAYSKRLSSIARQGGESLGADLREGVYVALTGPSYETPAEIQMLKKLGADAVGMSTVPEVIVGNQMGLEILAISCVTNMAAGITDQQLSHEEVTAVASKVKNKFTTLISYVIEHIDTQPEKTVVKKRAKADSPTKTGNLSVTIDHTLLKPEATEEQIKAICQEAIDHNFFGVCVNSGHISLVAKLLENQNSVPVAVVGFPLGAAVSSAKAYETRQAVKDGAREIDMVINLGALKARDYRRVLEDIQAVVEAAKPYPVKVIIETSSLIEDEKIVACALSKAAGAAFVKTSTGFADGGATVEDVALMKKIVGEEIGVKASGGIKSQADAQAMISAGANRIGTSTSVKIVSGEK